VSNQLLADADLCVKCGLCLPHCPTYTKTQDENESPRGRIALIQALASGDLPESPKLLQHIDNCLLCRSCERVCPAMVPYGRLIDNFRGRYGGKKRSGLTLSMLKGIVHHRSLHKVAQKLLALYQATGLQQAGMAKLSMLEQINRLLPAGNEKIMVKEGFFPATGQCKGEVGLFKGCMGDLLDVDTVSAAIEMLNHAGYNVYLPDQQRCCGALDLHAGDFETAEKLAVDNINACADRPMTAIVTIASGCGSTLQEYNNAEFTAKVIDISQFLYQEKALAKVQLAPLNATIVLHTPCSLRNVMREEQGALELIRQIPEAKIIPMAEAIKCCGAAGSYMLEHPEMSQAIRQDLLQYVSTIKPNYLITSNIGCALHIRAGVKQYNMDVEVLHPVVLMRRQLG
jgi:glycolate dehydrogenase iron-sulfur subunit